MQLVLHQLCSPQKGKLKLNPTRINLRPFCKPMSRFSREAVGNLLSNAVKYSPPETFVAIEAVETNSEIQIIVRDRGYGIPKNSQAHIFKKFYRLERDAASETDGTGLGLSFVKEVAEKQGGRVTIESDEGSGSTFILRLHYQTDLSHSK